MANNIDGVFSRPYLLTVALMLQCCVCLSSPSSVVCTVRGLVSKDHQLEMAYVKLGIRVQYAGVSIGCYERLLLCRRLCRLITVFVDLPYFRRSRSALKFIAVTDDHRRRSAFSVCFQCMTHAPVNQFLAAQTSLSRSVVGQNVMCM